MILFWLIAFLMIGGLLAWVAGRFGTDLPRWISLFTLIIHLIGLIVLWTQYLHQGVPTSPWIATLDVPWIPQLGIHFYLALDGLSLLLILLSNFLGIIAVLASWKEINFNLGFFHFNLLWILSALVGVFLAEDLFLFYFFWELMLVPLYLLIGIWGHENRIYATLKFFIFTQVSSLFMLLAILGLYFVHGQTTGVYTFKYDQLLGTVMPPTTAIWLMLGFFIAFATKLPVFPLHVWLPDAHTQAPTAGSVDLAGLVLKVGAYGFLRFLIPLFPTATLNLAPVAMTLGVIGILYGSALAFAQTNLKRLVAYTSVSHMGFVLLGVFSWNQLALHGTVMVMISHGISTGALFVLVGQLYERMHTRDLRKMGGLWETAPRMGRIALIFALASLGLPGLGNFVGEFLILLGAYRANPVLAMLATLGFILATVYSLYMIQRIFTGPNEAGWKFPDLNLRELTIMSMLVGLILWFGLFPQTILNTSRYAVDILRGYTGKAPSAEIIQPDLPPPLPIQANSDISPAGLTSETRGGMQP